MQISNASLTAVEGPVFLLQRDLPLHWAVLYQPTIQNSILASQWMAIYYHETFPHSCYNTVQYDHSVTPLLSFFSTPGHWTRWKHHRPEYSESQVVSESKIVDPCSSHRWQAS